MRKLADFRQGLGPYIKDPFSRPFVVNGSPFECTSFVVGFNAATPLRYAFDHYWSNQTGFRRATFEQDYCLARTKNGRFIQGNRRVIEQISAGLGKCLETNIYAIPCKRAKDLRDADKELAVIDYLFSQIKPHFIFAHSKGAMGYLAERTGIWPNPDFVEQATWSGHTFNLMGRIGPLYTMGADAINKLMNVMKTASLSADEPPDEAQACSHIS